ncbi:uncharacterized protein LOC136064750 [Quercus suber]|uniref:uncharacterized protein LOC136064750 n=1 Tax=Quercus suber TaxID=58331 RepID=UPI0032DED551
MESNDVDGAPIFLDISTKKYMIMNLDGGLWVLWKKDEAEIELLAVTEQEIHATVEALKSRLNVATFEDRNTSFYHITTVVRRQRNKIRSLVNGVGECIQDEEGIREMIQFGFMKLYSSDMSVVYLKSPITEFSFCVLSEEDRCCLERVVDDEEIREALWALKPFKAPRPDGLHASFFQHFWHDVKDSICNEVKKAFGLGVIPEYLNKTLITLIPKFQYPESLANYRSTSLCNLVYKIISKILVARIRPLLSNLISPIQTTFVPGRKGVDNVIIAQELIYTMDNLKGREGYMAVKVDLEKAYDRLEWSFIHKVLQAFHFPSSIIKVIMSCVSSSTISVLVNGNALEAFSPSRGIRQDDPLLPYLFILCMEYLGSLVEEKCSKGAWIPLKASPIPDVLRTFCSKLGQKVSPDKSRIYFSPNVAPELKERVCENLGMLETSNFGKYLGFSLRHRGASRRQFNSVAERVMGKLAGWKAKFLSFAGRAVLVKSVMLAIPNYVMQGAALPIHLCDKLDRINRDFLWGSSNEKRRMHLVGWEKIIRAKDEGGLGIQSARAKNIVLLAKLNWRIRRAANPDALLSFPNWSAIKLGFPTFAKGICWGIGNGSRKSVWIDNWIKGQSLRELIEGPLTRNDMKLVIADIRDNHEWNWENLSFVLPSIIKDKIRAIPCQEFGDEKDVILWKHTKDGDIPIREVLAAKGINCSKLCPICREQDDSIEHLLRECIFVRQFLAEIHAPRVSSMPINNVSDWLQANYQSKLIHCSAIPWNLIFPLAVWSIWKHHNKVVFENVPRNLNLHRFCLNEARDYFYCIAKSGRKKQLTSIPVKWNKPPEEWFKLNTNGASSGNPGKVGCGGLIRDCNGRWIKGFSRSIGHASNFVAEFWALRDGLKLALGIGVHRLVVELDAKVVISLITSIGGSNKPEGNRCADALARMGSNMAEEFLVFDNPPSPDVLYFVNTDAAGVLYNRTTNSVLAVTVR